MLTFTLLYIFISQCTQEPIFDVLQKAGVNLVQQPAFVSVDMPEKFCATGLFGLRVSRAASSWGLGNSIFKAPIFGGFALKLKFDFAHNAT